MPRLSTAKKRSVTKFITLSKSSWPHGLPIFVPRPGPRNELIVITEGAIKAIVLQHYLHDIQMVGLRGVRTCLAPGKVKEVNWSWEELLGPLWGRTAVILFDSDVNSNPEVRQALLDLRDALVRARCTVYISVIDQTGKVGPDDFLAKYGPDEVRMLIDLRLPATVAGRLALAQTPVQVRALSQDPVFLAMLDRAEPTEFVDTMMGMRGAGISGHELNGMRRRASSKMSLKNYVRMALSTTMAGWSMRRVREALRREEGLTFGNTEMWGIIQELRDKGEVPNVSRNAAMARKPSMDDASLDKRVRKIVGYVGKEATVRYVLTLFKDQSLQVDKDRLSRVLSRVKKEMKL